MYTAICIFVNNEEMVLNKIASLVLSLFLFIVPAISQASTI